jgi:hypothetical protein
VKNKIMKPKIIEIAAMKEIKNKLILDMSYGNLVLKNVNDRKIIIAGSIIGLINLLNKKSIVIPIFTNKIDK